jgi:hypothetical protein
MTTSGHSDWRAGTARPASPIQDEPYSCRSASSGRSATIFARRRRMTSSWIGIGFSHHNVPLSNTTTRSSGVTAADPSAPHVRAAKSTIARLVGPSAPQDQLVNLIPA